MKSYQLLFNKTNVLVLLIAGLPILEMALLFIFLFSLPKTTPDWIIIAIIVISLVLMAGSVILFATKQLTVPCKMTVNHFGISYEFERRNIFYRRNSFFSGWENVTNISENFNSGQDNFYRIAFKSPSFTINLSPIKGETEQAEAFFHELTYYQEQYNLSHLSTPIQSRNFYQSHWARLITWLFYIMVIVVIGSSFTDLITLDWYRNISMFCFGSVWVANYYKNTKRLY